MHAYDYYLFFFFKEINHIENLHLSFLSSCRVLALPLFYPFFVATSEKKKKIAM